MTPNPVLVHQCHCPVCQTGTDPAVVRRHVGINLLLSRLTEPQRRWYVTSLSQASDAPSDRQLARITDLHPETIRRGRAELEAGLPELPAGHQRQPGGGRSAPEKRSGLDPGLDQPAGRAYGG